MTEPYEPPEDRRDIHDWDDPHRDLSGYRWYNPILWLLLLREVASLIRWYSWHKFQSLRANRSGIHMEITFAMQRCELMRDNDDLPPGYRKDAERIQRALEYTADELNLRSEHLDRYCDGGENDAT